MKDPLQKIKDLYARYERFAYPVLVLFLSALIGYFAIHSNVGAVAYIEEASSLGIMCMIILLFMLKKRESELFRLFGFFSYEIYLFHWPLLYRYDFLYTQVSPWIATLLYLGVFIALAWVLKKLSHFILKTRG